MNAQQVARLVVWLVFAFVMAFLAGMALRLAMVLVAMAGG